MLGQLILATVATQAARNSRDAWGVVPGAALVVVGCLVADLPDEQACKPDNPNKAMEKDNILLSIVQFYNACSCEALKIQVRGNVS